MTLLSARDTPIARRFEIWTPNAEQNALTFSAGDCDQNMHLATDHQSAKIGMGEGAIGQVWATGIPAVRGSLAGDPSPAGRSAVAAGLDAMVALPVMSERGLKAIVVWYFYSMSQPE
jgi:hypothetical protein